jgi:hypothetical protein
MLLKWNDDLERIIREALELPGAIRAGVFRSRGFFSADFCLRNFSHRPAAILTVGVMQYLR